MTWLVKRRMMHVSQVNHGLPKYIFVFRDGVGDGQLRMVQEFEVPQLADCFANFGASFSPKLVVMVVQKRINQRIFAKTVRLSNNSSPVSNDGHKLSKHCTSKCSCLGQFVLCVRFICLRCNMVR